MLIPDWHLAILFYLYGGEYLWRFFKQLDKKFISLGKALGRFMIAFVYTYVHFANETIEQRGIMVRWALIGFVLIDLCFVGLEHILRVQFPTAK